MTKTILLNDKDLSPAMLETIRDQSIAIDTETTGLKIHRDRLCLIQIGLEDGTCYLMKMPSRTRTTKARFPVLCKILANPKIQKIFHYGRFDIAFLYKTFGVLCQNVVCTKISSKLVRTYSNKHGLKSLCKELLNKELSKEQQCSDWGAPEVTESQKHYAAGDVIHLHNIYDSLRNRMIREDVYKLAEKVFKFLPTVAEMDVLGHEVETVYGWE